MGGGDVRWHDRGSPDPAARGPGTDAKGAAAATFRVCRQLLDLGAGAAGLPRAGEPPGPASTGPATPQHPKRAGPVAGPPPKAAHDIVQRSR
jgi:hypothetical protein